MKREGFIKDKKTVQLIQKEGVITQNRREHIFWIFVSGLWVLRSFLAFLHRQREL